MCEICKANNCLEQKRKKEIDDNMTLVVIPAFWLILSLPIAIGFGVIGFILSGLISFSIPIFGIPYLNNKTNKKFQKMGRDTK